MTRAVRQAVTESNDVRVRKPSGGPIMAESHQSHGQLSSHRPLIHASPLKLIFSLAKALKMQQQLRSHGGVGSRTSSSQRGGAYTSTSGLPTTNVMQHSRQGALLGQCAATTTTAATLASPRHRVAAAPALCRTQPSTCCRATPEANVTAVQESLAGVSPRVPPELLQPLHHTFARPSARAARMHATWIEPETARLTDGASAPYTATDYICQGPLLAATGITPQQVQQDLPTWQKLGQRLAEQLGFDHQALDEVQR